MLALLGIVVILALVAVADASSGGWSTINWLPLGLLLLGSLVVLTVTRRRR
jgi:hypothetical protein